MAFRDAVNATVKAHGVNGLTRANLLAALNNIHKFDADGMLAPHRPRRPQDHRLPRAHAGQERDASCASQPTKPGTFDCNPKYVITRRLDLTVGGQGPQ